ncbi:MAG: DNA-binding protein [Geobacter sp.]|nr:MAG: DNA-binding protein [Geobacter sp.]
MHKSKVVVAMTLILVLPALSHGELSKPASALPKGHPAVPAATAPKEIVPLSGKVLQTMDSGGYTYIYLLKNGGSKIWVAIPKSTVAVGKTVDLVPGSEFKNFESKTLNRTFDRIVFSLGRVTPQGVKEGTKAVATQGSKNAAVPQEKMKVDKAIGPQAHTVAELFALRKKLDGKRVQVRGKVVKVVPRIMKVNWVHLQDGTGSPGRKDHDLVIKTTALPATGDTLTVTGTLLKDKDYGSGYKYDVLIDNAEIVR